MLGIIFGDICAYCSCPFVVLFWWVAGDCHRAVPAMFGAVSGSPDTLQHHLLDAPRGGLLDAPGGGEARDRLQRRPP